RATRSSHAWPHALTMGAVRYPKTVMPGTSPPANPCWRATASSWILFSDAVAALRALTWWGGSACAAVGIRPFWRGSKSLGGEKLGGAGEFGPKSLGLPLEAVGILCSALNERSLATLFEFHDLELETYGVVFQSGVHHPQRAYPGGRARKRQSAKPAARR